MPVRDWERIKTVFEQARGAPEEGVDRLIDSLCGGDRSMAAFVASLIRNDRDASSAADLERDTVFSEGMSLDGRFRIVRFIDRGAMGEVYEAFDERLRQRIALKTVRRTLIRTHETLSRFEREIRIAREVSHPNLCRVFDYLEDAGGVPCYTMELIQGESLAAILARDGPFSPQDALGLIRQIARGVDALHQRGIIHRDLKPSNIMLTLDANGEPRVVLMDFGLAKLLNSDEEFFQTAIEQRVGAPYFLAPELLRDAKPSISSDLYSFGLIVDEMVTKNRAFSSQSLQSLYFAKLWEAPIPPRDRSDSLPENWNSAILKCIESDSDIRFKSACEMLMALDSDETIQPLEAVSEKVARRLPPWRPRIDRALTPIAKRPLLASGVGAALLGGMIFLYFPASQPTSLALHIYDVENATGNPGVKYLCSGTSNELIRRLTNLKVFHVLPMHSIRRDGTQVMEKGVSVEGILRGSSDQLQLTVLLSDERTGEAFNSENFDLKTSDSLRLENEVAANTVAKIEAHLLPTSLWPKSIQTLRSTLLHPFSQSLTTGEVEPSTSDGVAFDSYMRGRQLLDEYSNSSVQAAVTYLHRAVEMDPNFALGYATLSEAQLNEMTYMGNKQQEIALADARQSATRAITLNPSLAETQAAMAYVLQAGWDWQGAEVHFQQALRLKPSYAAAKRRYAGLLLQLGKTDEALALARQAFADDPYDRGAIPGIGLYFFLAGHYDEAIQFLDEQIGENDMQGARHNLGDALAEAAFNTSIPEERSRLFDRAMAQASRVTSIERKLPGGATPMGDEMYAHYYTLLGNRTQADIYLGKLDVDMEKGLISPAIVAWIYALRGDKPKALDLLEEALDSHDRTLFYVKLFPALATIRNEDRFKAILARMNL